MPDQTARTNPQDGSIHPITFWGMPIMVSNFLVIDEIGKEGMLVRKFQSTHFTPANMPNIKGIFPKVPISEASIAEHVLNKAKGLTHYISASEFFPEGASSMTGDRLFIDINKAKMSGCKIYSSEEIIAELLKYKGQYPNSSSSVDKLIHAIKTIEKEAVIVPGPSGKIPPNAVYTPAGYNTIKRFGRISGWLGIGLTAYDLSSATYESVKLESAKPVTAELVRQAGSWGATWLGFKAGALAGVALAAPTGPGAVIGGLIGGLVFGTAGYFGADWVADYIHEN